MNIKDFEASLDYMFKAQLTPFVWGHAGIGKTTVVKKYALNKGFKFFGLYLGTQSDIGDILGLASFVKDKNGSEIATTFATPVWLKNAIDYCNENPDSGAVLFLDEFNRGRRDILNGMFSLALDKTFHNIKLPPNCHIIAAGNPPTDEYVTTDINDTALMARFVHIKLEPSFGEWVEFAKESSIEPSLIGFLQEQPNLLEDAKNDFQLPIKVDRRAYERLDRLHKLNTPVDLLDQLASGIIGIEKLAAYKNYLKNADKPVSGDDVLKMSKKTQKTLEKWSNPNDIKASLLNITCDNVFTTIKDQYPNELPEEEAANLMSFIELIPKDIVYAFLKKLQGAVLPGVQKFFANKSPYEKRLIAVITSATSKAA